MVAAPIAPPQVDIKVGSGSNGHRQSTNGYYISEKTYWESYYSHPDTSYEWKNGYLEEKPMAKFSQSLLYHWFNRSLDHFIRVNPFANIVQLDIGFRLSLPRGIAIRKPDMAVIRKDNPIQIDLEDRQYDGTFDLCIEVLSDSQQSEIDRDIIHKKVEYEQAGVQEYYILDDQKDRYTAFYEQNALGQYVEMQPTSDGVIQSKVLPGFQFRIQDLYDQPKPTEMANDPVYQAFVWPEYQMEKAAAAQERIRANQLEETLAQERELLQRYAAKMREMGISLD